MASRIQVRRDTAANWTTILPVLAEGELGIELDTGKMKIGNGTADWSTLPYFADFSSKVDKSGGWELNGAAADKVLSTYTADAETTAFATTLTNPADAPVDADALREDLVLNAFPQIREALLNLENLRIAYENLRIAHEDLRGVVAALVTAVDNGT